MEFKEKKRKYVDHILKPNRRQKAFYKGFNLDELILHADGKSDGI